MERIFSCRTLLFLSTSPPRKDNERWCYPHTTLRTHHTQQRNPFSIRQTQQNNIINHKTSSTQQASIIKPPKSDQSNHQFHARSNPIHTISSSTSSHHNKMQNAKNKESKKANDSMMNWSVYLGMNREGWWRSDDDDLMMIIHDDNDDDDSWWWWWWYGTTYDKGMGFNQMIWIIVINWLVIWKGKRWWWRWCENKRNIKRQPDNNSNDELFNKRNYGLASQQNLKTKRWSCRLPWNQHTQNRI